MLRSGIIRKQLLGVLTASTLAAISACSAIPVDVTTLVADDGDTNEFFGFSVAIAGDIAVVGAQGDDENGDESGAAYVFTRSDAGWSQEAKLTANDAEAGDQFGGSIALFGETILVGARRDDDNGDESGAAYLFTRYESDWVQQAKLTAADGESGAEFGRSVALSDDTAIIGAARDDEKAKTRVPSTCSLAPEPTGVSLQN